MGTQMLREYRRDGNRSGRNPTGMEFVSAGIPRRRFRNLANDKNSGASVRIPGKLSGERHISYMAAKYAHVVAS